MSKTLFLYGTTRASFPTIKGDDKMQLTKEDYVALVTTATPLKLVIINYELIAHNLHEAREYIDDGNKEKFEYHVKRSQDFLMVLMSSLDMTFDISADLMKIYRYVNKLMIQAVIKKDGNLVCEACDILSSLLDGWRMLEKLEAKDLYNKEPVMNNAKKLIAGITYKDGKLIDYVMGKDSAGLFA